MDSPGEILHRVTATMTYSGSATAIGSGGARALGLTSDDWTLIFAAIGAVVAVVGLIVNWVYRHLNYQLAKKNFRSLE